MEKKTAIDLPLDLIQEFCQKWRIEEIALFGSVLRDDFDPSRSDIDLLVRFSPDVVLGWDIVTVKNELEEIFKRPVDLVEREVIEKSENEIRKKEILDNSQVIYAKAS